MSHNVSRSKQDQAERDRRAAQLEPYLVPGWLLDRYKGEFVAIMTALGFHQRGQQMCLRCAKRDCRRRVEIDFREVVHAGQGDLLVTELVRHLRCNHWSGCELDEVGAIYPNGVPLVRYLAEPDLLVAVVCERCGHRLLLPPAAIIDRLKKAGQGDGSTGIIQLGGVVRGPCRQCGGRRFSSTIIRPNASGT